MPAVGAPEPAEPGTVAPRADSEQTVALPVAEAADAAAAQGDTTQVLPTVSTDDDVAEASDDGGRGEGHGNERGDGRGRGGGE